MVQIPLPIFIVSFPMTISSSGVEKSRRIVLTRLGSDVLIIAVAISGHLAFVLGSYFVNKSLGFPLDDAWIYQTFARNVAQRGEWAFVPGNPSTAATSILWVPILSIGHLFGLEPVLWTYLSGCILLILAGLGASRMLTADSNLHRLLIGLAVVMEWHLVWASASGMETILLVAAIIWFWVWFLHNSPTTSGFTWHNGFILGMWVGLLSSIRPEAAVAPLIAAFYGIAFHGSPTSKIGWLLGWGVGLLLSLLPMAMLNFRLSGELLPSTASAKQAEYKVLLALPFTHRFFEQVSNAFIGPQVILIPGLIAGMWTAYSRKPISFDYFLPLIWVLLHWGLYAARLPVGFQHGRYAMPTLPIIVIYSVSGALAFARPQSRVLWKRMVSTTWLGSAGILFPAFLVVLGVPAFVRDVAFIEQEMVQSARWLGRHIPFSSTYAAHDIGAIGYFAMPQRLIDLAGLTTPELIPNIHNTEFLADYIVNEGADYLIVFPNWSAGISSYQTLVNDPRFCPVWSTEELPDYRGLSGALGPMSVYEVNFEGECGLGGQESR